MKIHARLRQLVTAADPEGTVTVRVSWLAEQLDDDGEAPDAEPVAAESWRTRLWTAPDDALLGVAEIAEGVGRPASWVYRRTGPSAEDRLPVMKLDGEVVVRAADLRLWIKRHLEQAA
jgi:hypothetical protein